MKKFDRVEPITKDNSCIICFKTCPRKYFYRYVLGRAPKDTPQFFTFGTAYHKFREVLEVTYRELNPSGPYNAEKGLDSFQAGLSAAIKSWGKTPDPQVGDRFDFLTKDRLIASCGKAYKHWENEKKVGAIKVLATEQAFNVLLPDGTRIGGRADQIIRWHGRLWGRDFKTSSMNQAYYKRTVDPNNQFSLYTYAESELCGEPVQGQIVEVMYNDKKKGPEVITYPASRSPWQMDRWKKEAKYWDEQMTEAREKDMYVMNESSCSRCEYHIVCTSTTEGSAMAKLESGYKFSPWDHEKVEQEG